MWKKSNLQNCLKTFAIVTCCLHFLGFQACKTNGQKHNEEKPVPSGLKTIDFMALLEEGKEAKLSDYATEIDYVPLETTDECLIAYIDVLKVTSRHLLVSDFNHVYLFSRAGKFLRKIGKKGKGPGEYLHVVSLDVKEEKDEIYIYCLQNRRMLVYDFEGKHLRTYAFPIMDDVVCIRDSTFLAVAAITNGNEEHIFYLIDAAGDTTEVVNNHFKWKHKANLYFTVYGRRQRFYEFKEKMYFKDVYNDTIYQMDRATLKHQPAWFIDLGKYDMPDEKRVSYIVNFGKEKYFTYWDDYYQVYVQESDDYLWMKYFSYNYEKVEPAYALYNKNTGDSYTLQRENDNEVKLWNDLTGGPSFWPELIQNGVMVDILNPYKLIDFFETREQREVLLPEKERAIEEICEKTNPDANPIIRFVKLKS